jgi:hypothetical protein
MRRHSHLVVAVGALVALAIPLRAAERVTLRNGFAMACDHHAQSGDRMRLFTNSGEDSFIDVAPDEIVGVEIVPDPPVEQVPKLRPASLNQAGINASPDPKLSPSDLHEMLSTAGHEHNVDEDLLASLVKAESAGNSHAVSRTGARGLMQLMPATAADLGVKDSFRPEQNVRGGTTYLDWLLTRYRDNLAMALAAYNAGPAAVDNYHGIPPYRETRLYVARVIHEFNRRVNERNAQARRALAIASLSR